MITPQGREDWWRGAVIYQVYPRSFQDTGEDGIGDLPGILARLPYIASLGVDALWISPFFKSPQADFGYDVEAYREVDPLFGSLEDFDRLLEAAHGLGLKIVIDMVLSHTSNHHPWFRESRTSRDNDKADWYVWADWGDDGTPPNNWLSIFGGVAWEWEPRRGQYYFHNFLREQPDLNIRNPAVVEALLGEVEFWLRRGVDGLRLDAIDFAVHDPELRPNPPRGDAPVPRGLRAQTPYARQRHIRSKVPAEVPDLLLKPLRKVADRYGAALLGELSGEGQLQRMAAYTQGEEILHFAYSFELLNVPLTPRGIRDLFEELHIDLDDGWPCWSFGNHDVERAVTRHGGPAPHPSLARLQVALLGSLRGSLCVYQGEELGLPEAELAFEDLRDPPGIQFWPEHKGRDGCRTPMPWASGRPHGGFSEARPWLPMPPGHLDLAVDRQDADPDSTLHAVRRFLTWRRQQPELRFGDLTWIDAPEPLLAFTRSHGGQSLLCLFNLGPKPLSFAPGGTLEPVLGHGLPSKVNATTIDLEAYGAAFARPT